MSDPKTAEQINSQVLGCPFCGCDAQVREQHRSHFVVQCNNEHCGIHRQPELSPLAAITVWNERASLRDNIKRITAARLLVEKWRNEANYVQVNGPRYAGNTIAKSLRHCAKELEEALSP